MKTNTLDSFQLYYEEMELKQVGKSTITETKTDAVKRKETKPKVSLQNRINTVKGAVRVRFDNITKKLKPHRKSVKKLTKADRKLAREQKIRGIIGIGLLFVIVSIAYSTYMTNLFVDGTAMIIALAPQVVFAGVTLLIAFYKIYK